MIGEGGELFLEGPAGRLEAVLKRRPGARAAAVVCHPHPQYGGSMYDRVTYRAARAIHSAGLTVLRFNFRGVGASEGSFDAGIGERADVGAALDHLARDHDVLVVAGYSFGSWVGLQVGLDDPRVSRLVGIGLPVNALDFAFLRTPRTADARGVGAKPLLVVQGDRDAWGDIAAVRALVAGASGDARLEVIDDAEHSFEGHLERMMAAVTAFVASAPA